MLQETVFRPSVNDGHHRKLEDDVASFLESHGFKTFESTYHTIMHADLRKLVQNRFTPTALYIRARADRMAFHFGSMFDFEWECKTHYRRDKHDMTIEMMPMVHHMAKSKLGVNCLYCYRNPYKNHDCGFWVKDLPQVRGIGIPLAKQTEELWDWFEAMAHEHFPTASVFRHQHRNGSGDPYLIIDESQVVKLPPWKSLILAGIK